MAKAKRTKAQMLEDYSLIAMYSFRGENQKQIAKLISKERTYTLTQQTISNDLKALEKLWAEAAAIDINTEKGRLKAHYDYLISECYKAWERSQQDAVTITEGTTPKGKISTVQTQGQAGDGKYLSEIRALLAEYADLFGLHAPKAIKHEGEIEVVEQSMSPEQIAQKVVILMEIARKRKKDAGQ